ncbi:MAG: hypothetical protein JO015_15340 [Verrucomicrobia bacterium]|nr:hypothetical protein [Verrucomicrobiota bacterium]
MIGRLGEELTSQSRMMRRLFQRLRVAGDQLTGGGLRALGRRVLVNHPPLAALVPRFVRLSPNTAASLHDVIPGTAMPAAGDVSADDDHPSEARSAASSRTGGAGPNTGMDADISAVLPASARPIFRRLEAAVTRSKEVN